MRASVYKFHQVLELPMTTVRPSFHLMTTFVLAAALIVAAAVSPILQVAAAVVA
jgi:hypothetical protein